MGVWAAGKTIGSRRLAERLPRSKSEVGCMVESRTIDRIIGAFDTREKAERAVAEASTCGGDPKSVSFDDPEDERLSLRAEQQEEVNGAIPLPALNAVPGPAERPLLVSATAGALIGALVGLVAAFLPIGHWSLLARIITYVLIAGTGGSVIGAIIGGGLGAQGPAKPSASDAGVVVGISAPSGELAEAVGGALARHGPIRVDVVSDNGVARSVTDTRYLSTADSVRKVGQRFHQEHGDWSPAEEHPTEQ
jgi:hypothetical protein